MYWFSVFFNIKWNYCFLPINGIDLSSQISIWIIWILFKYLFWLFESQIKSVVGIICPQFWRNPGRLCPWVFLQATAIYIPGSGGGNAPLKYLFWILLVLWVKQFSLIFCFLFFLASINWHGRTSIPPFCKSTTKTREIFLTCPYPTLWFVRPNW